jgi:hypothetical protein
LLNKEKADMHHFTRTTFALLAILLAGAAQVTAQATRTWVSGVGDDANPCSRTAPCKTFAGAISKTAPAGEINALDPGGFGGVTITKSITIDGGPGIAGVLVAGTNGITVAAGATDVVILRNLDIDGINSGIKGIQFVSGSKLVIDHCNIYGFTLRGISIESTSANVANVTLISNTIVHSNTNNGIWVGSSVTNAVVIDNVSSANNANAGLAVNAGGVVQVRNSVFSNNNVYGLFANNAIIDAQGVIASNNSTGIQAENFSTIRLSGVSVVSNSVGLNSINNSVINSFGDNIIVGNASGNSGVTLLSKQ